MIGTRVAGDGTGPERTNGRAVCFCDGAYVNARFLITARYCRVVPILGYWLLSRIMVSNGTHVIAGTVVVLGGLISVGGWRWWTMRV